MLFRSMIKRLILSISLFYHTYISRSFHRAHPVDIVQRFHNGLTHGRMGEDAVCDLSRFQPQLDGCRQKLEHIGSPCPHDLSPDQRILPVNDHLYKAGNVSGCLCFSQPFKFKVFFNRNSMPRTREPMTLFFRAKIEG